MDSIPAYAFIMEENFRSARYFSYDISLYVDVRSQIKILYKRIEIFSILILKYNRLVVSNLHGYIGPF